MADKKKRPLQDYAKYSALGLQMAAFIVLCTYGGKFLDSYKWTDFPLFTVIGLLFGVFGSMYYLIRQL